MKKGILKPGFLKKSAGPSNFEEIGRFGWNNLMLGTTRSVVCQACLKKWPACEQDTPRTISMFLGLGIVEECCGALLDEIYQESGAEFTIQRFKEVLDDPKSYPIDLSALRKLFPKMMDLFMPKASTL